MLNLAKMKTEKEGYEEKVKESVRQKDTEKIDGLVSKMSLLNVNKDKYEKLKAKA